MHVYTYLCKIYLRKNHIAVSVAISPVALTFAHSRPTKATWRILPSNNPHFWHFPTAVSTH